MNYYLKVWQNFANFDGRARRSEYWMFFLFNVIISTVLQIVAIKLYYIYALAVLVPSIACAVRRMHDVGKSGWFALIPIYNFILAVTEGDSGSNEYGEDPKQS